MKRISILLIVLCAALAIMPHLSSTVKMQKVVTSPGADDQEDQLPAVAPITLSTLAASSGGNLDNLIGIDYQETSDSVIVSVHSTSGTPNNFVKVTRAGVVTPFSSASGFPEEVYFAIAPSQNCSGIGTSLGGFTVGDVFAGSGFGTGSGSTIARISADGTTVQNPFATLPGETGLLWGGLYFDRTGNFGGDLLVLTTTGGVYRVKSTGGTATLIARDAQNRAFEHIISLPNDSRFGPLAGTIIVGGTDIGLPASGKTNIYSVDPAHPAASFTIVPMDVSSPTVIEPEGFRIIPPNGDFFGTDFGGSASGPFTVVTAPSSGFSGIVGDLLLASEGDINPASKTSHLYDVVWDPVNSKLKATLIPGGDVFQYEAITMSCSCVPATLACPPNTCVTSASGGPGVINYATPITSKGLIATCTPPSGSTFAVGTTPVNCTADNGCSGNVNCSFNVTLSLLSLTIVDFAGSGSTLTININNSTYVFTCGDGFVMSGTATITIKGGIIVLEDNGGGKCVLAKIDIFSGKSVATLQAPMGFVRCQINGRGLNNRCGS
jgi:hypothetical protein